MNKVNDPVVTQSMLAKALEKNNKTLSKTIIDEIGGIIDVFVTQIDTRFNKVESDIADIKSSQDSLVRTIDAFIKRIDNYEIEQVARDAEVQRLKRWIEQIAQETGVKLIGYTK